MKKRNRLILRCTDDMETLAFVQDIYYDGECYYDVSIEDSYCGGDYKGILGRFKRAWRAFFAKPVIYTSVCPKEEDLKKWLEDCLAVINEKEK